MATTPPATPSTGFNFSSFSPWINAFGSRALAAMDYRLKQQPVEDTLNRRAYGEWLTNNAQKRDIAEGDYEMRQKGADAAAALQARLLKEGQDAKYAKQQEDVAAYNNPRKGEITRASMIGGPNAQDYEDMMGGIGTMARYGRTPGDYTGLTDLVKASSGASAAAAGAAGDQARSGKCPAGYVDSAFGGCQPSGPGYGRG